MRHAGQLIGVLEVRLFGTTIRIFIIDFGIDTSLGLIFYPLANEEFVFRVIEVTSLAFALVTDPVTLEMVSVTLGEHSIAVALAFVPLAFVNVLIRVDHATFTLR